MRKLFKNLKRVILPVCIATVLLVVQAILDLSLPNYTSRIVNVGIQQSGIEENVPTVLSQDTFEALQLLTPVETRETFADSYTLKTQNPGLKKAFNNVDFSTGLYVLEDTLSKEEKGALSAAIPKPAMLLMAASGEISADSAADGEGFLPNLDLPEGVNLLQMLSLMDEPTREETLTALYEKLDTLPDTLSDQAGVYFVTAQYKSLGVDMGKLSQNYILKAGGTMLLIALISMLLAIVVGSLSSRMAAIIGGGLRKDIYHNVLSFSNAEFDQFSTASLITRTTNDISNIQMSTVMLFRILLYAPIMAIGGIINILQTETTMTWIVAVGFAATMFVLYLVYKVVMPKFVGMQKLIDRMNLVSREILSGLSVIRAFGTKGNEEERFAEANNALLKNGMFTGRSMAILIPTITLLMNVLTIMIVWFGAKDINSGLMQVGDIMAFIQYTMQIIMSFLMIAIVFIMLPRATVSAERIDEVIEKKSSILNPDSPTPQLPESKGLVAFENVSFRYPGSDEDVLTEINFIAKPGETTAIIGSTGSGKSTLIHLIPRLFDTTAGSVLVGGVSVKNQNLEALRDSIGFAPQKGQLFSGTIESNIKFANKPITDAQMQSAAEIAQAEEFISTKSHRFESEIAQGGTNVSGGQRQRLSIARAIATDADILIFDDSFSALDFKTDAVLRQELKKYTQDKTVIIVAQRINTIMDAEQILVLEDGKIVGKGTHSELLKSCEVYKQIALSQLSAEELDI